MHARVEALVEDYNEVHEALARTRAEQARTRGQVLEARRRLWVARRVLGKRLWVIYTGGAPSTLGQLLAADSVHQALVTTKYQEQVVGADRAALDQVERLRRQVEALAASWPARPSARSAFGPGWSPSAARSSPASTPSATTSSG